MSEPVDELDFTLELKTDLADQSFEDALFDEAESRLLELRGDHDDITGAAVTIREEAAGETPFYEATVIARVRPETIVGREKDHSPADGLNGALEAVERQVRDKRAKLGRPWEQPGNTPVEQEVVERAAAEQQLEEELDNPDAPGEFEDID